MIQAKCLFKKYIGSRLKKTVIACIFSILYLKYFVSIIFITHQRVKEFLYVYSVIYLLYIKLILNLKYKIRHTMYGGPSSPKKARKNLAVIYHNNIWHKLSLYYN